MANEVVSTLNVEKKFNYERALGIIALVEKSPNKGNYDFLKKALNDELGSGTFKKMATLGFIHGGFYILNGKIHETYAVTQSYKDWNRIFKIARKGFFSRLLP